LGVEGREFENPGSWSSVQGLGFRVHVLGVRAQGSGFEVRGLGFRVRTSGFRVQGSRVPLLNPEP